MKCLFGSGSVFCYFRYIDVQDANKKTNLKKFFCLLLFEGTFTSCFKDKKSKRSHNTVESRFFLLFLLDEKRIRIRGGPKTCESGSGTLLSVRVTNFRICSATGKTNFLECSAIGEIATDLQFIFQYMLSMQRMNFIWILLYAEPPRKRFWRWLSIKENRF